jgi:hypothetical protein
VLGHPSLHTGFIAQYLILAGWWCRPVILALGDSGRRIKANLGYIVRPCEESLYPLPPGLAPPSCSEAQPVFLCLHDFIPTLYL